MSVTEIKTLEGHPLCDEAARARIAKLEGTNYDTRNDFMALLRSAEVESMRQVGKAITGDPLALADVSTKTTYYFDLSLFPACVYVLKGTTSLGTMYLYNSETDAYASLGRNWEGLNGGAYTAVFESLDGDYLAMSVQPSHYETAELTYIDHIFINPNYVSVKDGLDESISEEALRLDLAPIEGKSYAYFYLAMEKYKYQMMRIVPESSVWTYNTTDDISNDVSSGSYGVGIFAPVLPRDYILLKVQLNSIKTTSDASVFGITMGIIRPEKARQYKKMGFFANASLACHNADGRDLLTHAAIIGDWVDLDVCRTLDGHYVCIHGTAVNGYTIAETNLEDLGLTYNMITMDDAIEICKLYGCLIFNNFRETTVEQQAELVERVYSALGGAVVCGSIVTDSTHPLYGSNKYKVWSSTGLTKDQLKAAGIKLENVYHCARGYSGSNPDVYPVDYETISTECVTDISYVPENPVTNCFFLTNTYTNILND